MTVKNIRLSTLEITVLQLLVQKAGGESYGLELVEKSNGLLKKGSIYVTLGRMEEKGYISSRKEEAKPGERGLPKRKYKLTALGQTALVQWESAQLQLQGAWA